MVSIQETPDHDCHLLAENGALCGVHGDRDQSAWGVDKEHKKEQLHDGDATAEGLLSTQLGLTAVKSYYPAPFAGRQPTPSVSPSSDPVYVDKQTMSLAGLVLSAIGSCRGWRGPRYSAYAGTSVGAVSDMELQRQVDRLVDAIMRIEKPGRELHAQFEDIVTAGWSERLASTFFNALEALIRSGVVLRGAAAVARDRAVAAWQWVADQAAAAGEEAWHFAQDHPVWTAVIVLGMLVVLFPWALEALGFGLEGPVTGKAAV